jgi:hypothetical protein
MERFIKITSDELLTMTEMCERKLSVVERSNCVAEHRKKNSEKAEQRRSDEKLQKAFDLWEEAKTWEVAAITLDAMQSESAERALKAWERAIECRQMHNLSNTVEGAHDTQLMDLAWDNSVRAAQAQGVSGQGVFDATKRCVDAEEALSGL